MGKSSHYTNSRTLMGIQALDVLGLLETYYKSVPQLKTNKY